LRIATSADQWPGIPEEARAPALLRARLEEATGESVEWDLHTISPRPEASEWLEGWITDFDPEIVYLWPNPYYYSYESPALSVERRGGPIGRWAGRKVLNAGRNPAIASSRPFKVARRLATKTTAPAYHFTPAQVIDYVDRWLRLILRHELIVPLVVGAESAVYYDPDPRRLERMEARRMEFNVLLTALCESLHVIVDAPGEFGPDAARGQQYTASDGNHPNELGHLRFADREFPLFMEAWRRLRGIDAEAAEGPVVARP
jgi:hypothetical protein